MAAAFRPEDNSRARDVEELDRWRGARREHDRVAGDRDLVLQAVEANYGRALHAGAPERTADHPPTRIFTPEAARLAQPTVSIASGAASTSAATVRPAEQSASARAVALLARAQNYEGLAAERVVAAQ